MGRILIGTCSWTDKELTESGAFYPPEARTPEERLRFYATQFPLVEVDSTYYALPSEKVATLWAERTPPGFVFDVKAFRLFTNHPTSFSALPRLILEEFPGGKPEKQLYLKDVPDDEAELMWQMFTSAIAPLHDEGKLGVVLFQFPPWFLPKPESRAHILRCKERMGDYRMAVEFRNGSWVNRRNLERTADFLNEHGISYVCVDGPQGFSNSMPPLAVATAPVGLVRFHGRNTETWQRRGSASADRFDWWYQPEELQEWVPKIAELAARTQEVHLLMNTNRSNQGPMNANQLRLELEAAGVAVEEAAGVVM